ncbi:MAG TPA: hypothetical protein VJT73_00500, partial [Polyangiaceae bacterium]|nr:hypothetical protein [Polyangiaceae bacterium]
MSATSQVPTAGRHTVTMEAKPSDGHVLEEPVQASATSHASAEARQTVPEASFASLGQVVEEPVQVSTASQMPAEARQVVPALPAACKQAGAPPLTPHTSVEQTLPSSVHAVPAA